MTETPAKTVPSAVWRLAAKQDRRFRSGHPWVYSNELGASPKGVAPGAPVELQDAGGKFLAWGYGNPASLIAFRALSRNPEEKDAVSAEGVLRRLRTASALRQGLGLSHVSHRLIFGEADQLPGLIVDRFALATAKGAQVFVVQAHTAGMDRLVPELESVFEHFVPDGDWSRTAIVIKNDAGARKLEGLEIEAPRVARAIPGVDLGNAAILIKSASGGAPLTFYTDLVEGQKTGFFLDQSANIELAVSRLLAGNEQAVRGSTLRVLDLCCYVGQWGAQLAAAGKKLGFKVEVVGVDASEKALVFAKRNVEAQGAQFGAVRGDVLRDLSRFEDHSFDLVISDPPAFIKGRKDIPTGTHAYLQLNTQVFRVVCDSGAVICCSCSGLMEEHSFHETLGKAARRLDRKVQWIARGGQGPDHPILSEFSEGQYLKCWLGLVSQSF